MVTEAEKTKKRLFELLALVPILLSPILVGYSMNVGVLSALQLTASTNKSNYDIGEPITLYGNLNDSGGSPVTNALVSFDIRTLRGRDFAFRTISMGNPNPSQIFSLPYWPLSVLEIYVLDSNGNRISNVTQGASVQIAATIGNNYGNPRSCVPTITVYDKSFTSVFALTSSVVVGGGTNSTIFVPCQIPQWTTVGGAMIFCSVFDSLPRDGGTPYCPEGVTLIHILRNSGADYAYSKVETAYMTAPGVYSTIFRGSPDFIPGWSTVSVAARSGSTSVGNAQTQFNIMYNLCPPQAAFTNSPLEAYMNMSVTFDASSSVAEGFNSTIPQGSSSYEWNINDSYNMTHVIGPKRTSHTFQHTGVYTVELNVTDNQGLWSKTSKPIIVRPEAGPTANFSWDLPIIIGGWTVHFDASNSSSGWSVQLGAFSPITSYTWNFSDGTVTTSPNPTIGHIFTQQGYFPVQLNVTDSLGRTDTIAKTLSVTTQNYEPTANFTSYPETNLTVLFDASSSTPGWLNGLTPIVNYTWNFGDGNPNTIIPDATILHNFTQAGNYTVQLTITDSIGRTDTAQATITVNATSLPYPIWDINQDGKCNIIDVAGVARWFGSNVPPAPANTDITGPHLVPDGKVNILDISLVARHFGEKY